MLKPEHYTIIISLFPRLLGFIYFFAFGAFLFQIKGLIGKTGILPVVGFLEGLKEHYPRKCYFYAPTLFWLNASDRSLMLVTALGTVFSVCLMLGFYPSLFLLLSYLFYLSIVSVGQDFLSFGWEGFFLEMTAYAFLLSLSPLPNLWVWICLNVLLFRFHFQAGAVKIQSGDLSWKNLTALAYHYQTQPIPNAIAWYVHKLPLSFHRFSALLMFIIELVVPFGLFFTDQIRAAVFVAFFGLQLTIWLTGNFSYLNHLTAVFSMILLSNSFFIPFGFSPPLTPASPLWFDYLLSFIGALFLVLQLVRLWHHFFPKRLFAKWFYWLSPFHLVNPYGIFAIMTTERYEIVIEGSLDGKEWKEYLFWYKPSELNRRPRRISPYQPRLDWQVWFLPFSSFSSEPWFQSFLFHLLNGTPEVLKLVRYNPFSDSAPLYVRVAFYEYVFSDKKTKKEKGVWWERTFLGYYSPILSLKKS